MEQNYPTNVFTFNFKNNVNHDVRSFINENGSIWFVAKDVCRALGLSNPSISLKSLDDDERAKKNLAPHVTANIISESGLYALVLRSNKPEAKVFRKWVTSEVLPQIRQTGQYMPEIPAPREEESPQIAPAAITAFLQTTWDTFWSIEKTLQEHRAAERNIKKAKKDVSAIIRSIHEAFPASKGTANDLGYAYDNKLEVELR